MGKQVASMENWKNELQMMKQLKKGNVAQLGLIFLSLLFVAVLSRLIPHLPNFTAMGAVVFVGCSLFERKGLAVILPLLALFLSDMVLGFHDQSLAVYGAFGTFAILRIAFFEQKQNFARTLVWGFAASSWFFVITNFAVWLTSGMYAQSLQGLFNCYAMAIPFFGYQIAGDLFYGTVLYFATAQIQRRYSLMKPGFTS